MAEAVLVFGATGFIGRNLCRHLRSTPRLLIAVSRTGEKVDGADATVSMAQLDCIGPLPSDAVVIHVAAERYDASRFDRAQSDILRGNVEITNSIYGFCIERGIREVRVASSVAVYPAGIGLLDDDVPVDLNEPPNPNESFYAWSKRWGELLAELYRANYGISTVSFRLSNPYGAHDSTDIRGAHVLPAFVMRALAAAPSFEIMGNPEVERDFIYIDDVCDIFVASLAWRGRTEAMNLCTGRTTSLRELASTILELLGDNRPVVVSDRLVQSVGVRRSTNARLIRSFGKANFATLEEGLMPTIQWYANALSRKG